MNHQNADEPLSVEVIENQLVMRIGLDTLAHAAEHCPKFYDYKRHAGPLECGPYAKVDNKPELAHDVCRAMQKEREDGSSTLTDFLDAVIVEAAEQGSLGFADGTFVITYE